MNPALFKRWSLSSTTSSAPPEQEQDNNELCNFPDDHFQDDQLGEHTKTYTKQVAPSSTKSSPYAQFCGLPKDSFKSTFMYSNFSPPVVKSNVSKIPAEMCQGHFEGNPALPIAFLASFCSDLCGEALSQVTGMDIPFLIDSASPETNNKLRRGRRIIGRRIMGHNHFLLEQKSYDNMLRLISVDVDARKLVHANTHGLILSCEVRGYEEEEGSFNHPSTKCSSTDSNYFEEERSHKIYNCNIQIRADKNVSTQHASQKENQDSSSNMIANMKFQFELVEMDET